jgi:UDP-N-acetyl-D-glucosamine dehydrogenase
VLESTTYPGTTRELVEPILETGSGLRAQRDFFVGYSPERQDPGNPDFQTGTIPKVVGAAAREALAATAVLYSTLVPSVVIVSNPETAEAVKLTENIFRAVNIAMVNELKLIFEPMGIDIWEVIEAAKSKPFGYMPFYPGPGLGGHCIPIDPFYLAWKAREHGMATRFIELAGQINRNMPIYVVNKVREALSERQQKALNGARILVLGVAYKKNVDDMRESPALALISLLEKSGAETEYYDPHVPEIAKTREHSVLAGRKSILWEPHHLAAFDAVLIATDHDAIDWGEVALRSRLIIDTRNVMAKIERALWEGKLIKA